jgi:hypothetical protein
MKTIIRHLVCFLTLLAVCLGGLAQDVAPSSQGKVAILANDRILQGDIELVGKQYRIRRSIGESWLPADQVRCLCGTLEEAFAYLLAQANLNDGDERLRLARWCHLHGLKQHAADEAAAAVRLRPDHVESRRLLKGMQRSLNSDRPSEQPKEEAESETMPNLPYNASSLGLFVNKVQPILMNACARCHACGKGGSFKLARVYDEGGLGNRRTTQQNLMATLAQLNRERPSSSPLLTYALTLHGNADMPPLPARTAPAYRALEEWVQQALAGLPRTTAAAPPLVTEVKSVGVAQPPISPVVAPAPGPSGQTAVAGASWIAKWQPTAKEYSESPKDQPQPTPVQAESEPQPPVDPTASEFAQPRADTEATSSTPVDPFDPLIFNRQMHPGK